MNDTLKEQILSMKDEDLILITYYAKKYREIITRKGKIDQKTKTWTIIMNPFYYKPCSIWF